MDIRSLILIFAGLLVLVSLAEPLAARMRVPSAIISALLGMAIAATAARFVGTDIGWGIGTFSEIVLNLPFGSDAFLYVFLPILMFQAALGVQVRELAEEAAPIFGMAVVAVFIATFLIGFALWPLASVPLAACLLVGAAVATTDPAAVIAIFRDAGAPQRLTRIIDGESLLNDAAAVTLFAIFIEQLTNPGSSSMARTVADVFLVPIGGAVVGYFGAKIWAKTGGIVRDSRVLFATLTLAVPFAVLSIAEELQVSGFVAVVVAGMTMAHVGPALTTTDTWRYVNDIWSQLSFWASSLLFLLAALLIPRLLEGLTAIDLVAVLVVAVAALAARALVLYVMMPGLVAMKLSPSVSREYNLVILWGGLRGAATLALALAVAEHPDLSPEVKRFVAVVATGFTLFTLFVQGVTLRPLMLALGLDRLGPLDALLHAQALKLVTSEVEGRTEQIARRYDVEPRLAAMVTRPHLAELEAALPELEDDESILPAEERIAMALASTAARESELVLEKLDELYVSSNVAAKLLGNARRLLDGLRSGGRPGYEAAAEEIVRLPRRTRSAHWLHMKFRINGPLRSQLGDRFEILVVTKAVLEELRGFVAENIVPMFGDNAAMTVDTILGERALAVGRELDALRLQFPKYADALYGRMLICSVVKIEETMGERLFREGLINRDIYRNLSNAVTTGGASARFRPQLDLGLDTRELAAGFTPFKDFTPQELDQVTALLTPMTAIPGQEIIKRGQRGDACYFISSGAVEVDTGYNVIRLGRGEVFGEMAFLTGLPRQADVRTIAYCSLLVLWRSDFWRFLDAHPQLRQLIEDVVQERMAQNREAEDRAALQEREPVISTAR